MSRSVEVLPPSTAPLSQGFPHFGKELKLRRRTPCPRSIAYGYGGDLATVFAAVAISLMEQREGRDGGKTEGRGTLRLFITAGAVELLRLNPQWPTNRPTQRRPSLPPTDDSRGLSVVAAFPSLKGGIEVNERE